MGVQDGRRDGSHDDRQNLGHDDGHDEWLSARPEEIDHLAADEAHVWLIPLDADPAERSRLVSVLDAGERDRAARFRFPRDHERFIAAHGRMRAILARYAGRPAEALRFAAGPVGKPELAVDPSVPDRSPPAFNLSRSGGWALLGVAASGAIGVDIEAMRPIAEFDEIAERNFAPGETRALRQLAPARQLDGFFACWTRKEAYVKALGLGLSAGLDSFEVSVDPDAAALHWVAASHGAAQNFALWGARPLAGFHAAIVTCGGARRLRRLRYRLD